MQKFLQKLRWVLLGVAGLAFLSGCQDQGGYSLGGTVSGLAANSQLTLVNMVNHNTVNISNNGAFTFSQTVSAQYDVTVQNQPSQQHCEVTHGKATATANVSNIQVSCTTNQRVLYSFVGLNSGISPRSNLLKASDGNFYGTTQSGGSGFGVVFRVTPEDVETLLYSFKGGSDGANPRAALIQGTDGAFYGTTFFGGGSSGKGTVFKITSGGIKTTLYSFTGTDGANPNAALIQGTDGAFYGTTSNGGSFGLGTVFKITSGGDITQLYSFKGGSDGSNPNAALIQGTDGAFYGTTSNGGSFGLGTVFKITSGGDITQLYSFKGGSDGSNPNAALIQGTDGAFYGTTYGGAKGSGTVFKITSGGDMTQLYSFKGGSDGSNPNAALIEGTDGDFYGTTVGGGSSGRGTVFKITMNNGSFVSEAPLYSFTGTGTDTDGANPYAALIQGSDGDFYGTTYIGGTNNNGTVFKINAKGDGFKTLYSFGNMLNPNSARPNAALIQGTDGDFYGTTDSGGSSGRGTVFKINANGTGFDTLYSFTGTDTDGANPNAALIQGSDGDFYGTTYSGGSYGLGTVFKITSGGDITQLYSFKGGSDGSYPNAALIQGTDGAFYGTTSNGGSSGLGTVFKITSGGDITQLYSFKGGSDGANPRAALIQGADGDFYGTTVGGGGSGRGTVFKINANGTGFDTLYSFTGTGTDTDGAYPYAALIQGTDGAFYGTTYSGGSSDKGTVFKITSGGIKTTLYSFTGTGTNSEGANPRGGLIQGADGAFYGTTVNGGSSDNGTVFKITPAGIETVIHDFLGAPSDGDMPYASLLLSNGLLYGTTFLGGSIGAGTVFVVSPP